MVVAYYIYNLFSASFTLQEGKEAPQKEPGTVSSQPVSYKHLDVYKRQSFIYGGALTLEAEGYLSDRIALLIRLRERFMWGGASGRCHFQYGAGIKYIF